MNNIKSYFSIKDLENLSGIKAHTIRIWEKRYNILEPLRTDTNIRNYDLNNLQKLLNVTQLYNSGCKISKIAKLSQVELSLKVREDLLNNPQFSFYINQFTVAMLEFDQVMFEQTYNKLISVYSFKEAFENVFIPLLYNIGLLWQSDNITPANEHFISNLIHQKLQIHIERAQQLEPINTDNVFVLFLPMNEIHEFSLLYCHYELLLKGNRSIYLGLNIPTESLQQLKNSFDKIIFVTSFTTHPEPDKVSDYIQNFYSQFLKNSPNLLWFTGNNAKHINRNTLPSSVLMFDNFKDILNKSS